MRFLVDECTGSGVAKWLRNQGYEVFSVFDEARGISDEQIIKKVWIERKCCHLIYILKVREPK